MSPKCSRGSGAGAPGLPQLGRQDAQDEADTKWLHLQCSCNKWLHLQCSQRHTMGDAAASPEIICMMAGIS